MTSDKPLVPSLNPIEFCDIDIYNRIMRPRFDVFMKLDENRVRFIGTANTLEEAESLATQNSSYENPCFVLHSAFGVSSGVVLPQAENLKSDSLTAV